MKGGNLVAIITSQLTKRRLGLLGLLAIVSVVIKLWRKKFSCRNKFENKKAREEGYDR